VDKGLGWRTTRPRGRGALIPPVLGRSRSDSRRARARSAAGRSASSEGVRRSRGGRAARFAGRERPAGRRQLYGHRSIPGRRSRLGTGGSREAMGARRPAFSAFGRKGRAEAGKTPPKKKSPKERAPANAAGPPGIWRLPSPSLAVSPPIACGQAVTPGAAEGSALRAGRARRGVE